MNEKRSSENDSVIEARTRLPTRNTMWYNAPRWSLDPANATTLNELKIIRSIFEVPCTIYISTSVFLKEESTSLSLSLGLTVFRSRQSPRENFVEPRARMNYQATIFDYREYFQLWFWGNVCIVTWRQKSSTDPAELGRRINRVLPL